MNHLLDVSTAELKQHIRTYLESNLVLPPTNVGHNFERKVSLPSLAVPGSNFDMLFLNFFLCKFSKSTANAEG